jgi:predicted acetyltransferase
MSTADFTYGPVQEEADLQRLGELLTESFGMHLANFSFTSWFSYAGRENLRVLHQGGEVVGGMVQVPMGQFWGGRAVRMMGASGVAIAPAHRSAGAATHLMTEHLREARQQGFPLAALYPATQGLYRRVGYEQAGARFEHRARLALLPPGSRELPLRTLSLADLPAAQALYTELARARPGWLNRGPYSWHRVQDLRGQKATGYAVEEHGRLAGYTFVIQTRRPDTPLGYNLLLTDLVACSPAAALRLLSFLGDHASLAEYASWSGGAQEPLLLLWREQSAVSTQLHMHWMLRVVDVAAALSGRGWPRGLTATLHLEVEDPLLPENAGRHVLELSGGEGRVRPGGEGHLRCDARSLASLYSGYRTATDMARLGLLQGAPAALEVADALFAGPAPSMPDMF